MTTETSQDSQAQLADLDYDGHTHDDPPTDRITATVETAGTDSADDLYATTEGDVLWIDGTEYVVLKRHFGFFHRPLSVVTADGAQGRLIGGLLTQDASTAGVAWARDLPTGDDERDPRRDDLLATFDHVYRLDRDRLDLVHRWTPDSDHRECPACDTGRAGEPLRIEHQAGDAVELRQCTTTDCKHAYRFVRPFPDSDPDPATLLVSTGPADDSLGVPYVTSDAIAEKSITGVFRCTEQDDFTFPVETNDGRDDGFWTASEVAAFCNPKLDKDAPDDRFGTVTTATNDRTGGTVIRWRDEPGGQASMTIEFQELVGGPHTSVPDYGRALQWLHRRGGPDFLPATTPNTHPVATQ